jgi:gas vesicle protein
MHQAEANLKQEQMLFDAANRLYQLTGLQPGEKSGVVKNEKIADKKAAENMRAVKISAAMTLAYGNDDDKKKQVMQDIKRKYPELVKEIQELAKKAKERVKNDEFKKATVGLKFGKTSNESFKINEFGEIIRGGR